MKKLDKHKTERQIIHIIFGLVIVLLLYFDFLNAYSLAIITIIAFVLFYLAKKYKLIVIYQILERFERKEDLKTFPGKGSMFYLIGALVVVALFEKDIAMASIMILALGDSIPYIVGSYFRKIKSPFSEKKFLEGSLAGFLAAFIGAAFFVGILEAFFASLAAMIAEAIDIKIKLKKIDDNIIIPVVASCVVWVIRFLKNFV